MSTPTNYAKMTVAQLKEELVQKGLDTSGKKAELIERLTTVGTAEESNGDAEMETGAEGGDEQAEVAESHEAEGEETMEAETTETGGDGDQAAAETSEEQATEESQDQQQMEQGAGEHADVSQDGSENLSSLGMDKTEEEEKSDEPEIISEALREELITSNPAVPRKDEMRRDCLVEFRQRKVYAYPFLFHELHTSGMVDMYSRAAFYTIRQYERPPKTVYVTEEIPNEEKSDEDMEKTEENSSEKVEEEQKTEEPQEAPAEKEGTEGDVAEKAEGDEAKTEEKPEEKKEEKKEVVRTKQVPVEEEQDDEPQIRKFSIEIQFKNYTDAETAAQMLKALKEGVEVKQLGPTDTDDCMKDVRMPYTDDVSERLLYLGNLPEDVTDQQVESLFNEARYVFVIRAAPNENGERKCKGFAFVEFRSHGQMQQAFDASKERTDLVVGENPVSVVNYSRNSVMDVGKDLLDDKERNNLARQLNAIRLKMNRARRGMVMINDIEASKLQKRMQFLSKRLGADKRIRTLLGYDTPPNPEMPQDKFEGRGGGRGGPRGGPRGGGGGWRGSPRGRGGPPSLMDMPNRNRWGGNQQQYNRGGYGAQGSWGGYGGGRGGYQQNYYGGGYGQTNYGGGYGQNYNYGSGGYQQKPRGRGRY